jgi:peptide/nickel transport system substrate-binding protein
MVEVTLEKLDGTTVELLKEKPKYGGERTVVLSQDIRGFDEVYTYHVYTTTMRLTNEELIMGDWTRGPSGTGEIGWRGSLDFSYDNTIGSVAESWEILDDHTVRYKIRQGIHFALDPDSEASQLVGGREMNAHDVVYSLKRHFLTPGCYMQTAHTAAQKEGWDAWAEDDWTVVHQWNPELARVIFEYSDFCAIVAEEVIEEYGDMQDWRVSHGTGPFMLKDYVAMSSATLVRNPNYWKKHPFFGDQLPYLDGVKLLVIPDTSTRLSALRTGKIDAMGVTWEDAEELMESMPQLEYSKYLVAGRPISLRMDNPELPWYDKKVRYALALAIDNQAVLDGLFGGHGELLGHPVLPYPEFMCMYTPLEEQNETVQELFGYNPEKAKQLLAEAGYPDGFPCTVLSYSTYVDDLSVIKNYWEQIGVELDIDVRDYAVFNSMYTRKKQEQMLYGTPGSGANQPSKFSNYYGVGYLNYTRVDDPRCNEVMDEVDAMGWDFYTDRAHFCSIMKDIYPYVLEECWQIALPGYYSYVFWWPWLKDYDGVSSLGYFNGNSYLMYSWIDQDLKKEMGY